MKSKADNIFAIIILTKCPLLADTCLMRCNIIVHCNESGYNDRTVPLAVVNEF